MTIGNWIQAKMSENGWSQSELARRSSLSQSQISKLINGHKKTNAEVCRLLAEVFGETQENVMRIAGLLETPPSDTDDPQIRETMELIRNMPEEKQNLVARLVKLIFHE